VKRALAFAILAAALPVCVVLAWFAAATERRRA